ncbi:hypothetical protein PDIDSM_4941 [Penicillium digitatum]|nr:hypothetical protein PDIDSM_4941 [Penicillium digitatum]
MANDAAHRLVARDSSNGLQDTTPTLSGLLTTLIPALISFVVMVLLFVILRKSNRRMYMPRTYIGYLRPSQRTPESPTGTWDWIKAMYQLPDTYVLQHHSMDAYLMLRFLKLCSIMLFVGCCITFPILWPVNATGGGGKIQLNKLSISNIHETQYGRYYAHCFLAWIFVSFIFFMITREHLFYINLRQAYLFSPAYAGRLSSRTVLFTTVTQDLLNKDKLRTMFGRDKVKNVWIATDTKELEEKVEERDAAAMMLEGAETKLIVLANKARSKALKKQGSAESPETDIGDGQFDDESGSVAARWVEAKDRPTHRLTMLIGKKVDTINWARSEIERLSPEIEELQAKHRAGETKLVSSVFIEFYNQSDAQASFHVPSWIKGVITGLLPTVMMAVLMALVPIILRLMAKLGGAPSLAAVELTVQNWFFAFQIVQVFLVVTVASSATSVVSSIIHNPSSAASLLAQKIPTASNFYISYIILQGLSFSAGALLQISSLILGKVLGRLLDSTPRKIYTRWSSLSGLGWGTVYPSFTLLTVVAIVYSCIAPLVMGFGTIGLYLFYFAFRYNLLYVSNATIDTQGRSYTRALQHLTVGCYLSVVCLIGLFAIGTGANRMALGPLILMIIFLVFVILFHISMNTATDPLLNYLPKNLEAEEESLLAAENANISTLNEKSKIEDLNGASGSISAPRDSGVANMDNGLVDSAEKGLTENSSQAPKPNVFTKFLRPDLYHNYYQLRKLVPGSSEVPTYSAEVERDAYCHPAINSQPPLLWIPRDALGVSSQEVAHTSRVIPITDEDAYLDENCRIQWNEEKGQPPIYEEKIDY